MQHVRLENGRLYLPPPNGNEFKSIGIPPGFGDLVISPEDAVRELAAMTGRLAALPPRLVIRGDGTVPHLAQWEVTLDSLVSNETALGRQDAKTFYVSRGRAFDVPETKQGRFVVSVPQPNEPSEVTVRYPHYDEAGRLSEWRSTQITRNGTPSLFIPTVIHGGRTP